MGDLVVVKMTGDVAKEYATRSGMPKQENWPMEGVSISTMATVAQYRADGKYRIECSTRSRKTRIRRGCLTLTAIVDPKQLKSEITPKNTPVYASPADAKNGKRPTLTETEARDSCTSSYRTYATQKFGLGRWWMRLATRLVVKPLRSAGDRQRARGVHRDSIAQPPTRCGSEKE